MENLQIKNVALTRNSEVMENGTRSSRVMKEGRRDYQLVNPSGGRMWGTFSLAKTVKPQILDDPVTKYSHQTPETLPPLPSPGHQAQMEKDLTLPPQAVTRMEYPLPPSTSETVLRPHNYTYKVPQLYTVYNTNKNTRGTYNNNKSDYNNFNQNEMLANHLMFPKDYANVQGGGGIGVSSGVGGGGVAGGGGGMYTVSATPSEVGTQLSSVFNMIDMEIESSEARIRAYPIPGCPVIINGWLLKVFDPAVDPGKEIADTPVAKKAKPHFTANIFIHKDSTYSLSKIVIKEYWGSEEHVSQLKKYLDYIFLAEMFANQVFLYAANDQQMLIFHSCLYRRTDNEPLFMIAVPNERWKGGKTLRWRVPLENFSFSAAEITEKYGLKLESLPRAPSFFYQKKPQLIWPSNFFKYNRIEPPQWLKMLKKNKTKFCNLILACADRYDHQKAKYNTRREDYLHSCCSQFSQHSNTSCSDRDIMAIKNAFATAWRKTLRELHHNPHLAVTQAFIDARAHKIPSSKKSRWQRHHNEPEKREDEQKNKCRLEFLLPLGVWFRGTRHMFAVALAQEEATGKAPKKTVDGLKCHYVNSILTMEMAYSNARLVGPVQSDWLRNVIPSLLMACKDREKLKQEELDRLRREEGKKCCLYTKMGYADVSCANIYMTIFKKRPGVKAIYFAPTKGVLVSFSNSEYAAQARNWANENMQFDFKVIVNPFLMWAFDESGKDSMPFWMYFDAKDEMQIFGQRSAQELNMMEVGTVSDVGTVDGEVWSVRKISKNQVVRCDAKMNSHQTEISWVTVRMLK